MPLRLDNAKGVAHMPRKQAVESRFKIDHAASPMPEPDSQNASRPGRHQIGRVGEIISESWARSNRYTRARSSESAPSGKDDEFYHQAKKELQEALDRENQPRRE